MADLIPAFGCLVVVFGVLLIVTRKLVTHLSVARSHKRTLSEGYCSPPTSSYPHNPLLLYLDLFFETSIDVLRCRFTEGVRSRFARYGSTWTARLAYRNLICTIDPENMKSFMMTNFDDWTIIPPRKKLVRILFGDGVFSTEGDEWKHSRALVRSAMKCLDLNVDMFDKHAKALVERVRERNGGPLDLGSLTNQYSMGVAAEIVLGSDDGAERKEFERDFGSMSVMAKRLTIFVRAIPGFAQIRYGRVLADTKRRVHVYAQKSVDESAMAEQQDVEPLVNGMTRHGADPDRVRSEALNLLLGGRDSVGIGLAELFYFLARHPLVWTKLREEVSTAKLDSVSELENLPYLGNVIKEALRLRPPLAVHGRRAIRDTVLPRGGGKDGLEPIFVPKGAFVLYSLFALHRDPQVYGADADAFRPERWESVSPARYEHLPWGAGPRQCPGKKMSWTMMAYLAARLAKEFESIEAAGSDVWEEERAFSFTNRNGTHVSFGG